MTPTEDRIRLMVILNQVHRLSTSRQPHQEPRPLPNRSRPTNTNPASPRRAKSRAPA